MQNKPQTNIEHYIPRVYLKGFSDNGKSVYAFSLKDNKIIQNCPIETACQEKWLYELKDNNNQIMVANLIEEKLSIIEAQFKSYKKALVNKAFNIDNFNAKGFFTSEEKAFWKVYITIQMLRTPRIIKEISNEINNRTDGQFTKNEIRNYTLISVMPFIKELQLDNITFWFLFGLIEKTSICAFVDIYHSLFTSDNPIACITPASGENEMKLLFFPITPDIAIVLFGGEYKKDFGKNCLYQFKNQQLDVFKQSIARTAQNMIYSKSALNKDDIELIKYARESN